MRKNKADKRKNCTIYKYGNRHLRPIDSVAHTAVLLFARTPGAEARHKALGDTVRASARRLAVLDAHTARAVEESGLPTIRCTEVAQRGASFGERLSHAVSSGFALGYEHLIIIGNDCPELRARDLRRVAGLLSGGQSVIGPDRRGGAFLIGVSRADFSFETFSALPWRTTGLAEGLGGVLTGAVVLGHRQDINSRQDLEVAWYRLRGLRSLHALVPGPTPVEVPQRGVAFAKTTDGRVHGRRGPPLAA